MLLLQDLLRLPLYVKDMVGSLKHLRPVLVENSKAINKAVIVICRRFISNIHSECHIIYVLIRAGHQELQEAMS
ncbi:Uncharacterised protein [Escherichia coli]|uniref:Uncharacterized protein n=1 Tax=Escherichia coli TaxID=562 RepID=A0A2X3LPK0_ECOLX|nr:Uncharacterised protein [Escherichia coli]